MYETLSQNTKQRLDLIAMGMPEFIDSEITKRSFHFQAKHLILSLIRQRELIIRKERSHKNLARMLSVIDNLKNKMQACPNKDFNVSRFFLANEEEIRELIPGSYPNKRFEKFIALRDQARDIRNKTQ